MNNLKESSLFSIVAALFVAILIISNIASTKIISGWGFLFDGGTILFSLSYIFGDILTEVYGYARARLIIWVGFFSLVLMSVVLLIIQYLPSAPDWGNQIAYETILGFVPRLVVASIVAYWCGSFVNSYVLSKLKIITTGKYLWVRTIGSTILGEGVDTVIFSVIAFWSVIPLASLLNLIFTIYVMKVGIEVVFTPITYWVVAKLKKIENIDTYDSGINYNPFKIGSKKREVGS